MNFLRAYWPQYYIIILRSICPPNWPIFIKRRSHAGLRDFSQSQTTSYHSSSSSFLCCIVVIHIVLFEKNITYVRLKKCWVQYNIRVRSVVEIFLNKKYIKLHDTTVSLLLILPHYCITCKFSNKTTTFFTSYLLKFTVSYVPHLVPTILISSYKSVVANHLWSRDCPSRPFRSTHLVSASPNWDNFGLSERCVNHGEDLPAVCNMTAVCKMNETIEYATVTPLPLNREVLFRNLRRKSWSRVAWNEITSGWHIPPQYNSHNI